MKNKETPATLIMAPITSLAVTFWPKIRCAGHRINTGVRAIRVDAMPASV
jgi:hypothetical protein